MTIHNVGGVHSIFIYSLHSSFIIPYNLNKRDKSLKDFPVWAITPFPQLEQE